MKEKMNDNELEKQEESKELIITIEDDAGRVIECSVLTTFEVGHRAYIAVLPHTPDKDGSINIQLFRYKMVLKGEEEGIEISAIRSDMEFEEALKIFESLVDVEK